MPSNKTRSQASKRPSPKDRAAALKEAAPPRRVSAAPADSLATELHMMAGAIVDENGMAHFCDAAGRVLYKPVGEWIGFMGQRLFIQAKTELARQVNDPALDDDDRAVLALKLKRELRLDALHILAFRPDEAFDAARAAENDPPDVPAPSEPGTGTVSPALIRVVEAHREACQFLAHDPSAWDGTAREIATERRVRALADAIRDMPARTLADLRHKLIYLSPGALDEYVVDGEFADTLQSIHDDVTRLGSQPSDPKPAPVDFTPWDINGPCPVPTRERWLEDTDTILPWLRMGFLMLTLDREQLGQHLGKLDDQTFSDFTHSLGVAGRNFDQLCRFVALVQLRVDAALSAMVEEHGADAPCPGSVEPARG